MSAAEPDARPVTTTSPLRRVYVNAGKLLSGKIAAGLISVIYLAQVTRALGPADYGVLVLITFYTVLLGS